MARDRRCETCDHWDRTADGHPVGICRAGLPEVQPGTLIDLVSVAERTYWPVTTPADRCGYWLLSAGKGTMTMLAALAAQGKVAIAEDDGRWLVQCDNIGCWAATLEEAIVTVWQETRE